MGNSVIKGIELTFKLDHKKELLSKGLAAVRLADTEAHKLIRLFDQHEKLGGKMPKDLLKAAEAFEKDFKHCMTLLSDFASPKGSHKEEPSPKGSHKGEP